VEHGKHGTIPKDLEGGVMDAMNNTTDTTNEQVGALIEQWAAAERSGDTDALAALTTDDFTLVGPLGFVLDRTQWLDRYRGGGFVTHALSWNAATASVRGHGDAAIAIGLLEQQAEYQGHPANGRFRVTHIAVRGDSGWRLAGMHLSPVAEGGAR
jgi:ketosteroid isomerase-like protein